MSEAVEDAEDDPASWSRWELAVLALGVAYCASPFRVPWSDVTLFVGAFVLLLMTGSILRPQPMRPERTRAVIALTLTLTGLLALGFVLYGWQRSAPGLTPLKAALTLAIYLPFALLQQTLTQGFLVSRLGRSLPFLPAALVGGALFSLCHLPMPDLLLPTGVCGVAWALVFLSTGRLWPVVISHGVLGATYFLGVIARDPFRNLL